MKTLLATSCLAILTLTSISGQATTPQDGTKQEPTFTGKCELNLDVVKPTGAISIKAGDMAAVCIPQGWKIQTVLNKGEFNGWNVQPLSIKNILVISAGDRKVKKTEFWIYPTKTDSESPVRFEVVVTPI